jgi:hypothetical protein
MESQVQIDAGETEEGRRRIEGWARFNAVGTETKPSA